MGQSLVKNYIHIVFRTKHRQALIHPPVEAELHGFLGVTCNNLECQSIIVGGYTDHVHILCLLSKKIALMKLVETVKSHSSKWIKTKGEGYSNFLLAGWVWGVFFKPIPDRYGNSVHKKPA